jgi:hypothetical protein
MSKLLSFQFLLFMVVVMIGGCADSGEDSAQEEAKDKMGMATIASAEYENILPAPSTDFDVTFTTARHFSLSPSPDYDPLKHQLGNYTVNTSSDKGAANWSFGLDEEGMKAKLGEDFVAASRQSLIDYFEGFLSGSNLTDSFAGAVTKSPYYADMDLSEALDISGLVLQSVSVHDGVKHDADGDGERETAYSKITVLAKLPAFEVPTPEAPFPSCDELLATDALAQEYADRSDLTYVPAEDASWRYYVHIVAHFYIEDLSEAHGLLWSPTEYVSWGEMAAVSHDMGLIKYFLENVDRSFPESDFVITLRPDHEFARSTLHVVAELAKAEVNPDCAREVDGWLAGPGLLHPQLSTGHLNGEGEPSFLEQSYDLRVDNSDSSMDPGIVCLHDEAGNSFLIDGEDGEQLACNTPSGAIKIRPWEGSEMRTSHDDFLIETPYMAIGAEDGQVPHFLESMTCTDGFWGQACSSRFGRGIRICLTEWGIHNQVGDYWNIHWTQSPSRAAEQTGITAVAYIAKGVAQVVLGETSLVIVAITQGTAYVAELATKLTKKSLAGYSIKYTVGGMISFFKWLCQNSDTVIKSGSTMVATFVIGRIVDGLAQMAQIEATSWQDYSHTSKCACDFEFAHPNKCKGEKPSFDGWLGDLTRDGKADIVAMQKTTHALRIYPGNGAGGMKASYQIGHGWGAYSQLMRLDFDGDGINDVVARHGDDLRLFPRNASNGWKASFVVGNVEGADLVFAAGDWDHDQDQDIMGRKDGVLYLYPNDGDSGLEEAVEIGHGWDDYGLFVGPGDFDGDGDSDLIVRNNTTNKLWLYRGDGSRGFQGEPVEIGTGWGAFVKLIAGDFNGDQNPDLVGKTDSAEIHLYLGDGEGGFGKNSIIGSSGWSSYDIY